jgi:glycosyltransferase involved in cell wall biosynthesis
MARCLILPSLYEGFGAPVVEAMACGTPSVVSTGGALPEVGGDACLSFEPADVPAFAACLALIIDDDARHADLVARSLRRAPQFDRSEVARRLAAIYRELLTRQ